jgi:hypothetical protein
MEFQEYAMAVGVDLTLKETGSRVESQPCAAVEE